MGRDQGPKGTLALIGLPGRTFGMAQYLVQDLAKLRRLRRIGLAREKGWAGLGLPERPFECILVFGKAIAL